MNALSVKELPYQSPQSLTCQPFFRIPIQGEYEKISSKNLVYLKIDKKPQSLLSRSYASRPQGSKSCQISYFSLRQVQAPTLKELHVRAPSVKELPLCFWHASLLLMIPKQRKCERFFQRFNKVYSINCTITKNSCPYC